FSENGAEQLFLGCKSGFTLGRDFADQNVAGTNRGANADDAAFVEIAKERFADIGDIAGDFLGAELGVTSLDFKFLNVNGSVVVLLDQLLADQDGVFKVVTAPRQEGDQDVTAQRELSALGAGAVREHLPLADPVSNAHQRLLHNTGALVRTLKFDQGVDFRTNLAAKNAGVVGFNAHDNALGIY